MAWHGLETTTITPCNDWYGMVWYGMVPFPLFPPPRVKTNQTNPNPTRSLSLSSCEELAASLAKQGGITGGNKVEAIHGDRDQHERSLIMRRFKQGEVRAFGRGIECTPGG
jgi:hypothetical protein